MAGDSATDYAVRHATPATLEDLLASAEQVEQGLPLAPELAPTLHHGTSIGRTRPKALIADGGRKLIATFSGATDVYSVIKAEFIARRLAALAGLDVALAGHPGH